MDVPTVGIFCHFSETTAERCVAIFAAWLVMAALVSEKWQDFPLAVAQKIKYEKYTAINTLNDTESMSSFFHMEKSSHF